MVFTNHTWDVKVIGQKSEIEKFGQKLCSQNSVEVEHLKHVLLRYWSDKSKLNEGTSDQLLIRPHTLVGACSRRDKSPRPRSTFIVSTDCEF